MLMNSATPDVVDFTRATLTEITLIALPAIINASDADQILVTTTLSMFESAHAELEFGNNCVKAAHDQERLHGLAQGLPCTA